MERIRKKYHLPPGTPFRLHIAAIPRPTTKTGWYIMGWLCDPYTGRRFHTAKWPRLDSPKPSDHGVFRLFVCANQNSAWRQLDHIAGGSPERTPEEYAELSRLVYGQQTHSNLWAMETRHPKAKMPFYEIDLPDWADRARLQYKPKDTGIKPWLVYVQSETTNDTRTIRRCKTKADAEELVHALNARMNYVPSYPPDIAEQMRLEGLNPKERPY